MFPEPIQENDKVYIADEYYGWLPARVLELPDGDRALVRIELPKSWNDGLLNRSERWIDLKKYQSKLLPRQNRKTVCDVADMAYIHEAPLLYQLRERHLQQKPYTRVGDIVVAVNPCQWIDGLYSIENQALYARNLATPHMVDADENDDGSIIPSSTSFVSKFDKLGFDPHVYEISATAYRRVCEGVNQTILVTGESGAGKTETLKILLEHLELMDNKNDEDDEYQKFEGVLDSFPVYEAFGNAKTSRNENSSRVGRVLKLGFSKDGAESKLEGHTSETLLLESNRVVSPGAGERNFHIFYQILSATPEFKEKYLGQLFKFSKIGDFKYLSETLGTSCSVDDVKALQATLKALETFGWSEEAIAELMEGLACILLLGNLTFTEMEEAPAEIANPSVSYELSARLGLDHEIIERMLTHKKIITSKEMVEIPLDAGQSKDACDSLAKRMYETIFNYIVDNLNRSSTSRDVTTLSLVDIYGFECFDTNRFDQLCINYVNEKLQQKYLDDIISRCTAEYEDEGIDLFDTTEFDNSERLQLLEGRFGIMNTINEECVRPKGSAEEIVRRIKVEQKDNICLADDKLSGATDFTVVHFVGPVTYSADAFLQRNINKLSMTLYELLGFCKNSIFNSEYERIESMDDVDAAATTERSRTVLNRFKTQVKEFLKDVEESECRYVRCIKPNEDLATNDVDHKTMLRQLRCSGLVSAVDLTAQMYPNNLTFETFLDRYRCLIDENLQQVLGEMPIYDQLQLAVSHLFSVALRIDTEKEDFVMPYAIGKSKVFFRSGALEALEAIRYTNVSSASKIIQHWAKMAVARLKLKGAVKSATKIQALYRSLAPRTKLQMSIASATLLQSWQRMRIMRRSYVVSRDKYRMKLRASREDMAARKIVSAFKTALHQRKYEYVADSIVLFQAVIRGGKVRKALKEDKIIATNEFIEVRETFDEEDDDESLSARSRGLQKDTVEDPIGVLFSDNEFEETEDEEDCFNIDGEASAGPLSELSDSQGAFKNSDIIERLQAELKRKDEEILSLRKDIHQVTADAETHNQRIESEFEDRLLDYEEEVLSLKQKIVDMSEENTELKQRLAQSSQKYQSAVKGLQARLHATQSSHKDYLNQILETLEKTDKKRKAETARLQAQIDRLRTSSVH